MPSTSPTSECSTTTIAQDEDGTLRLERPGTGNPPDGRHGLFVGRLPLELFIHVASYFEWKDLVRLSAVCCAWRKAVLGHAGLWKCMGDLDIERPDSVDRARAAASRARGALRSIHLIGGGWEKPDLANGPAAALSTLRQILHVISVGDGGRGVREITLDLLPYEREGDYDLEDPYAFIVILVQYTLFAAVDLRTLTIDCALSRYPSSPFFAIPSLYHLTLGSQSDESGEDARLPAFLSQKSTLASTQAATSSLRTLVLSGTSLNDFFLPSFPFLSSVKLYRVNVPSLFRLLSKCAETLETLWLCDVTVSPPLHPLPISATDIPTLPLPLLASLRICGDSPFMWDRFAAASRSISIVTPTLSAVSFSDQQQYGEAACLDCFGWHAYPACRGLNVDALTRFFGASRGLVYLNLRNTNATPAMLSASLPYASHALAKLDLSNVATDALVDRLHDLVPCLSHLIVEGWFNDQVTRTGSPRVSLPALARLASRLVPATSPNPGRVETRLRLVADKTMRRNPSKDAKLTLHLRTKLFSSPFQVDGLIESLALNTPPGGPSLSKLKQDIAALMAPPPGLRLLGRVAYYVAASELGDMEEEEPLDAVEVAMGRWLEMKEANAAVQWCAERAGVELVCGADDEDYEF